jgi:FdhE protein
MKTAWDARVERATELISVYPFAAEALRFYAQVVVLQQKLFLEFQKSPRKFFYLDGPIWGPLNSEALLSSFANFLKKIRPIAPGVLAEAADQSLHRDSASQAALLETFWLSPNATGGDSSEGSPSERCLAWLFLQPAAEYLSTRQNGGPSSESCATCPQCGSKPIVGVLRPEGDGAKKSLICMLCAHEWRFRRICCPACGEEREPHMAFYTAAEIPHVRVDVCHSCHSYLKSVDLTKTGLAIPVVDELATIPLDLWARENGYQKLQLNMVGM